MAQSRRILGVTLGLVGLGALAGAACGAAIPVAALLLTGRYDIIARDAGLLTALGAGCGAVAGGVAGPAAAWGLLRRVPLGKAVLWGAAGTVAGALAGELLAPLNPYTWVMPGVIPGSILGLLTASAGLRLHTGRAARRAPAPEPPNVR
jgi:hypothetical protein